MIMSLHLFEFIFVICELMSKISCQEDCWYPFDKPLIGKMCYFGILDDDPDCDAYASCAHATYINQTDGNNELSLDCRGMIIYYLYYY